MNNQNIRTSKRRRNDENKSAETSDNETDYESDTESTNSEVDSDVDEHGNLRGFIAYSKDELNKRRKISDNTLDINEEVKSIHTKKFNDTMELIKRSVPTLDDIMQLDNIIDSERADLLIKYAVMGQLIDTPEEYYKYANHLKELIDDFRNSKQTIDEKNKINTVKIELKNTTTNMCSLEKGILMSDMPQYHKTVIYHKYNKLRLMSPQDSEYYKLKDWIELAIKIPFNKVREINMNGSINKCLTKLQDTLDKNIYGMDKIKEELLYIVNNKITNKNATNSNIALVGKPGTGKTAIIRSLAESLDVSFQQISLGGLNDSSYLDGYGYTYIGSKPGKIMESLIKMGNKNGIIYFDEIDKLSGTNEGSDVTNILLHIIDFTQNMEFTDKYFSELPVDISKIWFIFSLNDPKLVDPILLNRLQLIEMASYTIADKTAIIRDYLLATELVNVGLDKKDVVISDDNIRHIIHKTEEEEGIRKLKYNIILIVKKINMLNSVIMKNGSYGKLKLSYKIDKFKLPIKLTKEHINVLLDNFH
ncbi:MAG: hypothetical protein Faunusvirus17_2 [Faunusvirus sp.]|jgi:ATP-dependent Lon protease|uniref:AAA+ ATPase domain-containing protein n=1 Tax=Faunusvirus sp. TaxID=2487766 RepID=A0A3G5A0V4_9VIRU|nr:MAG: hypothetical protein Faunusvirus17_2 [Faunusvirus sp.]